MVGLGTFRLVVLAGEEEEEGLLEVDGWVGTAFSLSLLFLLLLFLLSFSTGAPQAHGIGKVVTRQEGRPLHPTQEGSQALSTSSSSSSSSSSCCCCCCRGRTRREEGMEEDPKGVETKGSRGREVAIERLHPSSSSIFKREEEPSPLLLLLLLSGWADDPSHPSHHMRGGRSLSSCSETQRKAVQRPESV